MAGSTRWFPPGTPVSSTRKLISSSFHRLDMTLAVAGALNPNKPNHQSQMKCVGEKMLGCAVNRIIRYSIASEKSPLCASMSPVCRRALGVLSDESDCNNNIFKKISFYLCCSRNEYEFV